MQDDSPTVMSMTNRFEPSPHVSAQRLDDETMVLVHLQTDRIYELNRTGARLWELLENGHDSVQVRSVLLREFVVDEPVLDAEVARLLDELAAENLVIPRS